MVRSCEDQFLIDELIRRGRLKVARFQKFVNPVLKTCDEAEWKALFKRSAARELAAHVEHLSRFEWDKRPGFYNCSALPVDHLTATTIILEQ